MNSRGMEMAIQIFIVLFVLLAVSMLVLNLVSEQFESQGNEIDKFNQDQAKENKINKFKTTCNSYCNSNQVAEKAKYCLETLSLSDELVPSFNKEFQAGIGVCEDKIYCSMITNCSGLSMTNCKALLCNYWASQSLDANTQNNLLETYITPGKCYNTLQPSEKSLHWFGINFDKNYNGTIDTLCS